MCRSLIHLAIPLSHHPSPSPSVRDHHGARGSQPVTTRPWLLLFLFHCTILCISGETSSSGTAITHPLPLLPISHETLFRRSYNDGWKNNENQLSSTSLPKKLIPRHIWVGMKVKPSTLSLPDHLQKLFNRSMHDGWQVNVAGNKEQLEFMETYWPGTSVLWAFKSINPALGNAACDIWRYAVLYAMGGLYLDDDSYLETPLEHIVKPRDELIMTIERNPFKDNCYVPSFHASAVAVAKKYSVYANVTKTPLHHKYMNWALVSWGIFAAPGHAAILKMLENMVEVLWAEYNRNSMIWNLSTDRRWKIVMCTTGPAMLTATIREYWAEAMANETLRNSITNHMRVELTDFKDYGGMFKVHALYNGHYNVDKQHYMVTMQKQYISLLHTYVPFNISKLEKKAVTPGGKKVYWVENGALHLFPNYDTMMSKNITAKDAVYVGNWSEFGSMPEGPKVQNIYIYHKNNNTRTLRFPPPV